MDGFWRDLRLGLRRMTRAKALSGGVIFILALGIGPNALMFSVLRASLLRPLPYAAPERLVMVRNFTPESPSVGVGMEEVEQWQQQGDIFESVAAYKPQVGSVLTGVNEPAVLRTERVSRSFFAVLGIHPAFGPGLVDDGAIDEVILSDGLWRRQFKTDRGVVGRRVSISNRSYTVAGVMPEGFDFPRLIYPRLGAIYAWIPLELSPAERRDQTLDVVARLRPGVSAEVASQRLTALLPASLRSMATGARAVYLREAVVGQVREGLLLLLGATALVLVLACANVANLLLAGAGKRQRDAAIQVALGATRGRVARQALAETLLLAFCGGALGLVFGFWGTRMIPSLLPSNFPRLAQPEMDVEVIILGLLSVVVVSIVAGLAPALAATAGPVACTLAATGTLFTPSQRHAFRSGLVAAEIGLALLLATTAVLTLRGFWRLVFVPAGFDSKHVLTVRIALPQSRYGNGQRVTLFLNSLLARLASAPSVEAVGVGTGIPGIYAGSSTPVRPTSDSNQRPRVGPEADQDIVSGGYFRAMGIPLLTGRTFGLADQPKTQPVVIVDAKAARLLGPGSVLHKQIVLSEDPTASPSEVVGIVGSVHLFGAPQGTAPHIYLPITQFPIPITTLVVRSQAPTGDLVATVRRVVRGIDPDLPIGTVAPLPRLVAEQTSGPRFHLAMFGAFALLALALASFGAFSVTAYVVSLRKQEFAVRTALGATPATLVGLVMAGAARTILQGVAAGVITSTVLANLLAAGLPEVKSGDPLAFGAAIVVVVLPVVGATLIAARRASHTDPAVMLRAL